MTRVNLNYIHGHLSFHFFGNYKYYWDCVPFYKSVITKLFLFHFLHTKSPQKLHTKPFRKRCLLKKERTAPTGSKFLPFKVDTFYEGEFVLHSSFPWWWCFEVLHPFQHHLSHIKMMGDNERLCAKKRHSVVSWIPPQVMGPCDPCLP